MIRALAVIVAVGLASSAGAQMPTSFTYQGLLTDNGSPANGLFDFEFRLFRDPLGTEALGPALCADGLPTVNGNFVVELDFGAVFSDRETYLRIAVRDDGRDDCSVSTGFTPLAPLQKITPVPQAMLAGDSLLLGGQPAGSYRDASNLSTGTLPAARLPAAAARTDTAQTITGAKTLSNPANVFAGSGAGLTGLSAGGIASGVLDDARLSGNVARLASSQAFTGANSFSSPANAFTGSGAGLTALNAAAITTGTLADARLPAGLARAGTANTFTGVNTFSNAGNVFTGSGAGLTSLSAGAITTGTLAEGRLPAGLPRADAANTFTGINAFTNAANTFVGVHSGSFVGSGSGLTDIPAGSIVGPLPDQSLSSNVALLGSAATQNFLGVNTFANPGNAFVGGFSGSFSGSGTGLIDVPASAISSGTVAPQRLPAAVAYTDAPNAFLNANTFVGPVTFDAPEVDINGRLNAGGGIAIPPTDRFMHLGPADFTPDNHTTVFTRTATLGFQATGAGAFWAPLHLPDGAVIIGVLAEVRDAIPNVGGEIQVVLRRTSGVLGGPIGQTDLATISTSGSSPGGAFEVRAQTVGGAGAIVDNETFAYAVVVTWGVTPANATPQQIKAVRVDYRITSPMP